MPDSTRLNSLDLPLMTPRIPIQYLETPAKDLKWT